MDVQRSHVPAINSLEVYIHPEMELRSQQAFYLILIRNGEEANWEVLWLPVLGVIDVMLSLYRLEGLEPGGPRRNGQVSPNCAAYKLHS